jgi:hypothetical protein
MWGGGHGASHGYWCKTRVWRTRCLRCQRGVFFFSCNCGSKVFFDRLGVPWPEHDCDGTDAILSGAGPRTTTRNPDGSIEVHFEDSDIRFVRPPDPFEAEYIEAVMDPFSNGGTRHAPGPDPIRRVPATGGRFVGEVGRLREIDKKADIFAELGMPDTAIARQLLGPLGGEPLARVVVHAGDLGDASQQLRSYRFFVPRRVLRDHGARRGQVVAIELDGVVVKSKGARWFCSDFEVIGG